MLLLDRPTLSPQSPNAEPDWGGGSVPLGDVGTTNLIGRCELVFSMHRLHSWRYVICDVYGPVLAVDAARNTSSGLLVYRPFCEPDSQGARFNDWAFL